MCVWLSGFSLVLNCKTPHSELKMQWASLALQSMPMHVLVRCLKCRAAGRVYQWYVYGGGLWVGEIGGGWSEQGNDEGRKEG